MPFERHDFGVVHRDGAVRDGGTRDREREAGVVGVRVVEHVGALEPVAVERGELVDRFVDADPVVTLADPETAGEVVHPERAADQGREPPIQPSAAREHGYEEREHANEMRRVLERSLPFVEPLVDQAKLALVEVAETAVHELGAPRAGAGREVVAFDQRGAEPAAGGVERDAGAGDAATHHEQVEVGVAQPAQRVVALETRTIGSVRHTSGYRPLLLELASATGSLRRLLTQLCACGAERQVSKSAPRKTAATPTAIAIVSGSTSALSVPAVSRWTVVTANSAITREVDTAPDAHREVTAEQ